jgi:hypothetical protein
MPLAPLSKFSECGDWPRDRLELERWRPNVSRVNAIARAIVLLAKRRYEEALKIVRDKNVVTESVDGHRDSPPEFACLLLQKLQESLALPIGAESVFKCEGDYYTIIYQGHTARLRATRGLHCLAQLLCHAGREFHVSELITEPLVEVRVLREVASASERGSGIELTTSITSSSFPMLDAQAKAQYKCRLMDLRADLDEAERFNDGERAARSHEEMNAIAEQLASAVGLGGRDRSTSSDAERARSAVTKRIKQCINKIDGVIPLLGRHFATHIKTGYFCSYILQPDHPVAWRF